MREFICNKCGLCCMNLNNNPIYDELNNGEGVCVYFDRGKKLCSIYDHRPIICNVKLAYFTFFKDEMTYEDYLRVNYEACKKLKGE